MAKLQNSRKRKFEEEMEEIKKDLSTHAEANVCAPVPESDPVLKVCEQIAETLKLIQSDLAELKKRFV